MFKALVILHTHNWVFVSCYHIFGCMSKEKKIKDQACVDAENGNEDG